MKNQCYSRQGGDDEQLASVCMQSVAMLLDHQTIYERIEG